MRDIAEAHLRSVAAVGEHCRAVGGFAARVAVREHRILDAHMISRKLTCVA